MPTFIPVRGRTLHLAGVCVNRIGTFHLYVSGQGQIACVGCSAHGTAYVDPFIQIDPNFAQADEFALVISAGIGNFPPNSGVAPEPSTWAMLLIGFVGLGFASYRMTKSSGREQVTA